MAQEAARVYWRFTILWLIVGSALGILCAFSLLAPGFLSSQPIMGYGRLLAAHRAAMIHGVMFSAVFATAYSLLPRLSNAPVSGRGISGIFAWAGMAITLIGILEILIGHGSGSEYADFPLYVSVAFWVYLIAVALDISFILGRGKSMVTHPAAGLLFVSAVLPAIVYPFALPDWWGTGIFNALRMWTGWRMLFIGCFAAGAIGLAVWLLGTVRPRAGVHAGAFVIGIWLFTGFGALMGAVHLLDAPLQAPIKALGAASGVLSATGLIMLIIALWKGRVNNPTSLLNLAGLTGLGIAAVQGIGLVIPPIYSAFHYTSTTSAHAHLALGSLLMIFLAGGIVLAPRLSIAKLTRNGDPGRIMAASGSLIAGVAMLVVFQTSAGVLQASAFSKGLSTPDWLPMFRWMQLGVLAGGIIAFVGILLISWPLLRVFVKPLPAPIIEDTGVAEESTEESEGFEDVEVPAVADKEPEAVSPGDDSSEQREWEVWDV